MLCISHSFILVELYVSTALIITDNNYLQLDTRESCQFGQSFRPGRGSIHGHGLMAPQYDNISVVRQLLNGNMVNDSSLASSETSPGIRKDAGSLCHRVMSHVALH